MREEKTTSKSFRVVVLLSVLACISGCSGERFLSNWAFAPPVIDGSMDEWKQASLVIFEDERIAVGVGNDSSFLYLAARVSDNQLGQSILNGGFTVWLSRNGGKGKDFEIRFPAGRATQFNLARGGFWKSLSESERSVARERVNQMQKGILVIDESRIDSRLFSPDGKQGFAAAIGESGGLTSFELRIPLDLESSFAGAGRLGPHGIIGIGLELAAVPGQPFAPNANRDFGRQPGGVFGRGGRGDGRGGASPRNAPTTQRPEIWLEVRLAQPE